MVKMFSNYQISIISHVKISFITCVQIPHFSVVEILVKHCSLYNKITYLLSTYTSKSLIGSEYFPSHMSILLQQVFQVGIFKIVSIQVFLANYFETLL